MSQSNPKDFHYRFENLVDLRELHQLQDDFWRATGYTCAIVNTEGKILAKSGGAAICNLHQQHEVAASVCQENYLFLHRRATQSKEYVVHRCPFGLVNAASSISIEGHHLATLLVGQVFFEPPQINDFVEQARELSCDKSTYLQALSKVPVVTEEEFLKVADYLVNQARFISLLGLQNLQKKELEQKLEVEKNTMQAIFNGSGDAIRIINVGFEVVNQNPQMDSLSGASKSQAVGKLCWETFNHHFCGTDQCILQRILRGETRVKVEVETERPDGRKVPVSLIATPLKDQNGTITGVIESYRDITDRKKAEEQLVRQKKYFEALFRASADAIAILDKENRITDINPRFQELFRYSLDEIKGLNLDQLLAPPDKLGEAQHLTRQVLEEGKIMHESLRMAKDGRLIPVLIRNTAIYIDNKIAGIQAIYTDITKHKETEKNLEEAHQRLLDIIDFLPDATFVIDQDGKVIAWNKAIEDMTGVEKEEILGKGDYVYAVPFYGRRRPVLIDLIQAYNPDLAKTYVYIEYTDKTIIGETFAPNLYNGKGAHLWVKASPLYDSQGHLVGAIESIRDISKRKQVEEKLKYLSIRDKLTGLYNRNYFEEEMRRIKIDRHGPVSIIVCDLDGLKLANDTMGHDQGDKYLKVAAQIIKEVFRETDCVARIGGDEFAVLLPFTGKAAAEEACHRIRVAVSRFNESRPVIPLHLSIGTATGHEPSQSINDIFKEADNNMYREKLLSRKSNRNALVRALTAALEQRDFNTQGHSQRLEKYCVAMGYRLGLSKNNLDDLRLLAQFHDIGKVGISDAILFKPGPLSLGEYEKMKMHCEIGHRIALSSPDLAPIADLILKHHEWWNGKGYPLGLSGEDIPLACRILAIADAYDAMTSDRPYRKALTRQEAVAELKRCAGTQFDPDLVNVFINLINKETQLET
ncbi:MAG: PAS domain S-box protein [Peptococcaceae bacterium]|nr:PAS domain S-box protein [Peptococcaceae bacterium]